MKYLRFITCFIFLFSALLWLGEYSGYTIRLNQTYSLPFYVFTTKPFKKINLKKDIYISLSHPKTKGKLAKKIIGLPGDRIHFELGNFWINNQHYGCLDYSEKMHLSPIQAKTIPDGYVFVYATHPKSFDSRYEEFGLIAIDQIKELLCPLF